MSGETFSSVDQLQFDQMIFQFVYLDFIEWTNKRHIMIKSIDLQEQYSFCTIVEERTHSFKYVFCNVEQREKEQKKCRVTKKDEEEKNR